MSDEPELRLGAAGEWVEYLQQRLEESGHSPGTVDGGFGEATEAAVKSYQQAHGLNDDGVVGPATWAALTAGTDQAGEVDVPQYLIDAGAPAVSQRWTDDQKNAYFSDNLSMTEGGDGSSTIEVASIQSGEDGSMA